MILNLIPNVVLRTYLPNGYLPDIQNNVPKSSLERKKHKLRRKKIYTRTKCGGRTFVDLAWVTGSSSCFGSDAAAPTPFSSKDAPPFFFFFFFFFFDKHLHYHCCIPLGNISLCVCGVCVCVCVCVCLCVSSYFTLLSVTVWP
jgi:hypothetical protein